MILKIIAVCLIPTLGVFSACAENQPAAEDQVLYLKLNEGSGIVAADQSGRENHGRITARGLWRRMRGIEDEIRWVEGLEDYAVEFDGETYFLTAANEYNGLSELSVSFLIWQPESEDEANHILGNTAEKSASQAGFNFLKSGEEHGSFAFRVCDGRNEQAVTTDSLPTEQWAHVAGVFKGGREMRLYIDGELESAVKTNIENTGFNDTTFRIGVNRAGESCLPGTKIDEVRIWRAALEDEEVRDLHGYYQEQND